MEQNQNPSGNAEAKPVAEPVESKSVSYESYSKVLGEKKRADAKMAEISAKLEAIENERLNEQGKYKELNSKIMEEKRMLADTYAKKFKDIGSTISKQQFSIEASKLGCINADDAFMLFDSNRFELDDNFRFKDEDLKLALGELQKNKPYLFKNAVSSPRDLNSQFQSNDGKTKISSLKTSEQIMEALRALDAQ